MAALTVHHTDISGLLVFELPLHGDARGWFKENWQRAKMLELGLPDFGPVQNNMSFNATAGSTRGLHAEPWDKLISLAHGQMCIRDRFTSVISYSPRADGAKSRAIATTSLS